MFAFDTPQLRLVETEEEALPSAGPCKQCGCLVRNGRYGVAVIKDDTYDDADLSVNARCPHFNISLAECAYRRSSAQSQSFGRR